MFLLLADFLVTESLFRRAVHVSRSGHSVPTKFQQDNFFILFSFLSLSVPFDPPAQLMGSKFPKLGMESFRGLGNAQSSPLDCQQLPTLVPILQL